ncbi:MAG: hypothetical protein KF904_14360 [Rhodoblastus sp.]|nr:hypothetical protein [Rhodoblastus sp.]
MADAMNAVVNAPTPQAKAAAMDAYERMHVGGAIGGASPASTAAPTRPASGDMADAINAAMNATTPQQKREALERIERLSMSGEGASPPNALGEPIEAAGDPGEASDPFPRPDTMNEYRFIVPPEGSPIANEEGVGEIKAALFDAGVPAEFANMAFQNAVRNYAAGVLESDQSYDAAVLAAKAAVEKQLGAEAPATLKLAVDYLNDLLAERPALQEAIDLAMCDPWALMQAANLARSRHSERTYAFGRAPDAAEAARIKGVLAGAERILAENRRSKENRESVERVYASLLLSRRR